MTEAATQVARTDDATVRPFQIDVADGAVDDMRRRIEATRWPERETVTDDSQGVPLALMQELARYWATDYDWGTCEARLNALPRFMTEIDGLDVHFIHVRSPHENALPLIVTNGWPGSVIEQLKIVEPLTNPTAYGASPDELYQAPRSWAERAYPDNLLHDNRLDRGGHFAAWEQPELFSEELRTAFRTLR